MNLKEIIEATLIELDRGTAADTVAMYAKKFTMYANEAVEEIARRFKACKTAFPTLRESDGVIGFYVTSPSAVDTAFNRSCKRIDKILKCTKTDDGVYIHYTIHYDEKPYYFEQLTRGENFIHVIGRDAQAGDTVAVDYLYVPKPMRVSSLDPISEYIPANPDIPDIPEYMHKLIPMYVRAREQCGQDPSTQGTSNAYFSLFNQAVYNLQRETLATPDSFQFKNYHFE